MGGSPLICRSTPRISERSLDCHLRTISLGSFFLNRSMKPMANGRLGRETASTCAKECHRGGTLPGVTTVLAREQIATRDLARPARKHPLVSLTRKDRTRSSVFRVSPPVQHAGAHSRGSAGESNDPPVGDARPCVESPARASTSRNPTPRTLKISPRGGIIPPRGAGRRLRPALGG